MKVSNPTTTVNPTSTQQEFNEVITIEVPVQEIYKQMVSTFPEDYKHKELVAHAIVGSALRHGGLSYVYNALNGYSPDINFQVGDMVVCTSEDRHVWYDSNQMDSKGNPLDQEASSVAAKPNWKRRCVQVGNAKVVGIDLYSPNKLVLEFETANHYDENKYKFTQERVDHRTCTKVVLEELTVVNV